MNNDLDNLKKIWQASKSNNLHEPDDKGQVISSAKQQMKRTISMQLGTILVLVITLVIITLYFFYVAKFRQTISHIGTCLMVASLATRIIIEIVSIYLSSQIDMGGTTLKTNLTSLTYYRFRKRINGPVTIAIIISYSIGFYLLTPEFRLYFSTPILVFIDGSYILIAALFIWIVRKTIREEMSILNNILQIQSDIIENEA